MDTPTAKKAIITHFLTQWGTTTRVALDNEVFTPVTGTPWVRVTIRYNAGNQESLGMVGVNRNFLRSGSVIVQCFAPQDAGSAVADSLAAQALDILEATDQLGSGDIRMWDGESVEIGQLDGWYQVNTEVRFEHTEVK